MLALQVIKFVVIDIAAEILYWPVWWYTRGVWEVLKWAGRGLRDEWIILALGPWLKSMCTPMYADYSLAGRAISFVFRMLILGYRVVKFSVWFLWYAASIVLYATLPAGAAYALARFIV